MWLSDQRTLTRYVTVTLMTFDKQANELRVEDEFCNDRITEVVNSMGRCCLVRDACHGASDDTRPSEDDVVVVKAANKNENNNNNHHTLAR